MNYHGLYINLDKSTDRRIEVESEFGEYNLGAIYRRINAVEGNPSGIASPLKNHNEIGCFLSHVAALKEGMKTAGHLHIIEDDTIFTGCTQSTIEGMITSGVVNDYDILFTDIALPLNNDTYRRFKSLYDQAVKRDADGNIISTAFQVLDLKDENYTAASSYIVSQNAFRKLEALYDAEIAAGVRVPVDDFLKLQGKVGALKIGCVFPFITSMRVEHTIDSTIRKKPDSNRKFTAANIGRYSFFIGCDWNECERLMQAHIAKPNTNDKHTELLGKLLAFSLGLKEK